VFCNFAKIHYVHALSDVASARGKENIKAKDEIEGYPRYHRVSREPLGLSTPKGQQKRYNGAGVKE
jgi:hypothetical protein